MKARGSTDPKVGKKKDDQDEDSHDQDEDHVEEYLATVAKLQEDQKEEVHDSQSKRGAVFRSEGAEQPSCDPNHPTGTRPVTRGQLKLRLSNQQMRGWQDSQQEFQVYLQSKEKEVEATRTGMEEKYGKGFWEMDNEGKWVHDYQGPGGATRTSETSRYLGLLRVERNLMEARNTLKIQEERDITIQALEGDAGAGSVSGANASTGSAPGADAGAGESATGAAEEPEDDPEDPVGEALINRKYDIWDMIGEVRGEGLKLTDDAEKEEQEATMHALVGVTKTLEVQIKSHLKKIKLETKTLKRRLKKKKLGKKKEEKEEKKKKRKRKDTGEGEVSLEEKIKRIETAAANPKGEEAESQKDKTAVKHLIKATGNSEANCIELIAMHKVPGVSTIQAYYKALLDQVQSDGKGAAVAVGMGASSTSGTRTGPRPRIRLIQNKVQVRDLCGTADAPETDRQMRVQQRNIKRRKKEKEDERKKAKKTKEDESKAGPSNWRRSGDGPGSGRWGDMTTGEEQVVTDLVTEEEQMVRDLCDITGCTEEQCAEALATNSSENRSREEIWSFAYDMLKLIL